MDVFFNKKSIDPYLTPYKNELKWIIDINVKPVTLFLEENVKVNFCDLGLGKDVSENDMKIIIHKGKFDKCGLDQN